jgi:hypothetical protein
MTWLRFTYGILPSREQFFDAFERIMQDRSYSFGNDPRLGNGEYTTSEIWAELLKAVEEGTDVSLDWASCVLYTLEIEWI